MWRFSEDLGIDLGTANIVVYARGRGIILREPSVVAIDTRTKKVKAERARAVDCDVTIGTWAMAMEGLDIPAKDTVFFATPKADVEQACGRIRRIYGSKKPPMIVDICDDLGFLHRFARKRENYYVTSGLDKGVWVIRYVKRVAA